jgi:hypothetical protein
MMAAIVAMMMAGKRKPCGTISKKGFLSIEMWISLKQDPCCLAHVICHQADLDKDPGDPDVCRPQCPRSEYKASAPVVARKTDPNNQNPFGIVSIIQPHILDLNFPKSRDTSQSVQHPAEKACKTKPT